MRHSDNKKLVIIRTVKFVIFLLIFICINSAICYYLSPSAHKSNEMWQRYFAKTDADTIFVGTSVTEMIKEYNIDEFTGRKTVNMGTPSQYFATSRDIIRKAAEERPIDTVVLLMGFDALERDEDLTAEISVEKAYYDNYGFCKKLCGFVKDNIGYSLEKRNIDEADSVNKWMSWPVDCLNDFDDIKSNLEKKEYYGYLTEEAAADDKETVTYDRVGMSRPGSLDENIKSQIADIKSITVSEDSLLTLRQIAGYCTSNGITLMVAISPHKTGYSDSFEGDYEKLDALTKSFTESMGCIYINMDNNESVRNLMTDEYFEDSEHVTHDGIEAASGVMSDILNLLTGKRN